MLTGVRLSDGAKVVAADSEREHAPFGCPTCRRELILNKGRIKVHHFRHKPPSTCPRGEGETEAHLRCKFEIYRGLLQASGVTAVELEKDLGPVQPDVYAVIRGVRVGIEVQRSHLSVNVITARTRAYQQLGVHVLWIAHFSELPAKNQYNPKAWEKWLHAAYMGRVYYWLSGLNVQPVHFSDFMLHVEHRSWFESGGVEQSAGGFDRRSKRYRTPVPGPQLRLDRDFGPRALAQFSGGSVFTPQRLVYLDGRQKWWT